MTSESTIRKQRRRVLLEEMKLAVELACESHGKRHHLEAVFVRVVKLLRMTATHAKTEELLDILTTCAEDDLSATTEGKKLYINGTLILDELDKYMVWGSGVSVKEIGT
jgi:C4-type Zn-finger protein